MRKDSLEMNFSSRKFLYRQSQNCRHGNTLASASIFRNNCLKHIFSITLFTITSSIKSNSCMELLSTQYEY